MAQRPGAARSLTTTTATPWQTDQQHHQQRCDPLSQHRLVGEKPRCNSSRSRPPRRTTTSTTTTRRVATTLVRLLVVVYAGLVGYFSCKSHNISWKQHDEKSTIRTSLDKDNKSQSTTPYLSRATAAVASRSSPQRASPSTSGSLLVFNETSQELELLNKIFCRGQFGLGHRLSKLAAAYHLACRVLHLPRVQVHWGSCSNSDDDRHSEQQDEEEHEIFRDLFGSNRLQCPPQLLTTTTSRVIVPSRRDHDNYHQNKTIVIRNDVVGYYAGQAYKNAQVPIDVPALVASTNNNSNEHHHPWLSKLDLDTLLFQDLLHNFVSRNTQRIQAFQQEHDWNPHSGNNGNDRRRLVIGLHIRAGNGEQDHFAAARRDSLFDNNGNNTFVQQLANLIHQLIILQQQDVAASTTSKPPLVFLATDTVDYIPLLQNAFTSMANQKTTTTASTSTIQVVTFPQERVPVSQGVSYQQWTQGQACRNGWRDSFMDMALLAQSDIVIAATRSTFTQILPQALVWKNHRNEDPQKPSTVPRFRFCQVGRRRHVKTGKTVLIMSCFANQRAWLFGPSAGQSSSTTISASRDEQVRTFFAETHLQEDKQVQRDEDAQEIDTARSMTATATDVDRVDRHGSVVHKILVHFPDVEQDPLTQRAESFLRNEDTTGQTFAYGRRIASKYRGKGNDDFRTYWTTV